MRAKRKSVLLFIIATLLISIFTIYFTGCSKPATPLSRYDFSSDNITEVGIINSSSNDGGNPYGDNVWRIKDNDARLSQCAKLFEDFSKNSFMTCNYNKKPFATGGSSSVVCIFKSEEGKSVNYVKITFLADDKDEHIIEIQGSYYKTSKTAVDDFRTKLDELFTDDDLALSN